MLKKTNEKVCSRCVFAFSNPAEECPVTGYDSPHVPVDEPIDVNVAAEMLARAGVLYKTDEEFRRAAEGAVQRAVLRTIASGAKNPRALASSVVSVPQDN